MKRSYLSICTALSLIGSTTFANNGGFDVPSIEEVIVPIEHVFAPLGFDENDHQEILASLTLPSTCYKSPQIATQRNGQEIKVSAIATKIAKNVCIPMEIPVLLSAPLGHLEPGEYKIDGGQSGNRKIQASIQIVQAETNSIDDFDYAHVAKVDVDNSTGIVTISGVNPSSCVELDRIMTITNKVDTIAVLPIMKQITSACPVVRVPFSYTLDISKELPHASKILLHVRSLNGFAKNELYTRQAN